MSLIEERVDRYLKSYSSLRNRDNAEFERIIYELTSHHIARCGCFRDILESTGQEFSGGVMKGLCNVPFIHTDMFKFKQLSSIEKKEEYLVMRSSGTSGRPSLITLSSSNAKSQRIGLAKIVEDFVGLKRPAMVVVDKREIASRGAPYTARKAGIIGFGQLARKQVFAIDTNGRFDKDEIARLLEEHEGRIMIFGFTHVIWRSLQKVTLDEHIRQELSQRSVLIHGGGWKKLERERVSREDFNRTITEAIGTTDIRNYYGMVEQTGSIFMECESGYLHENKLNGIIARSAKTLEPVRNQVDGIAHVFSVLSTSYPGHSLLTDDVVTICGDDGCICGREGKFFRVKGRLSRSEARGCSDAYN